MKLPSQIQIPIPSREQITQQHVGTLLSSLATLLPYFHIDKEDEQGGARDGGTRSAVEATVINICGRLDNILADDGRWTLAPTKRLEDHLCELYTQNIKVLKLQQQQIYAMSAPHARHNPSLHRLVDGSYAAILGSIDDLPNAIVGVGGSPAQALEAFDEIFNGNIPSHLAAWMEVREEALEKNMKPPTKAEYDQSQSTAMDSTGGGNAQSPEGPKNPPRGDRPPTGEDEDSGGSKGGSSAEI